MNSIFSTSHLFNKRLVIILLLGFSSGLPLALTSQTLQAWFTVENIDIFSVGLLGLVGQPYVYKFLWAPLLDRFSITPLGRRRGWMLVTQLSLCVIMMVLAGLHPQQHALLMGMLALVIVILSASQDIAIDAFRTESLPVLERGSGSAMYIFGYRIAMIISGGAALIMADKIGWHLTYLIMGCLMLVGAMATWFAVEPNETQPAPATLQSAIIEPWREFMTRDKAIMILLLIIFYKLGDAFIVNFSNLFLLRGLGFTLTEVGSVNKIGGVIATLFGVLVGGALLTRINLFYALISFSIFQTLANFLYMILAIVGKNFSAMVLVVLSENIINGMCTVALLAFLMGLCDKRYTATQYALFSALSAIGRVFIGPLFGYMVEKVGWIDFFFCSVILTLPTLVLLLWLRAKPELFTQPQTLSSS